MLSYTEHARDMMKLRNVSESEVEYCIENYEIDLPDKKGNFVYKAHTPSNRYVKVVVDKRTKNQIQVITVVGD